MKAQSVEKEEISPGFITETPSDLPQVPLEESSANLQPTEQHDIGVHVTDPIEDLFHAISSNVSVIRSIFDSESSATPVPIQAAAHEWIQNCEASVLNNFKRWELKVASKENTVSPTEKLSKAEKVEEEIRKAKLRDIMRMKEELQKKLISLNENAEVLESMDSPLKIRKDKEYYMLSKEDRKKLKEDLKQKEAEAYEFVKKKQKEEKERRRKLQEKAEQVRKALRKKMEEEMEFIKQKEAESKAAKKEQMIKNFESLKQKHNADIKRRLEQEEKYHPQSVYLYQKIEERYKNKILLPSLEDKKQKLAEKRNILKPVTKEDLEAHQKALEEYRMRREEERKRELERKKKKEAEAEESLKRYQTRISSKIYHRDTKVQEEMAKKEIEKRAVRSKMTSYASLLKEVCPITPSEDKAAELQKMIQRIKHPVKQQKDVRKMYELATLNKRRASRTARSAEIKEGAKSARESPKPKVVAPLENIIDLKPKVEKKHDYLTELRLKREEKYKLSRPNRYNWSMDIQNEKLAPIEKRELVERKARMIEEQAKLKEKLFHIKGGVEKNLEMGEYVTDMFLDAIKAKLALLGNM